MKKLSILLVAFAVVLLGACNSNNADEAAEGDSTAQEQVVEDENVEEVEAEVEAVSEADAIASYLETNNIVVEPTESGLYMIPVVEGTGKEATAGSTVVVDYVGTLLDGTQFDSSIDRGEPIEFVLGEGQVIAGWDEAIAKMKEGCEATLIIPSQLAYGEQAQGDLIPANSPLVFNVTLKEVK